MSTYISLHLPIVQRKRVNASETGNGKGLHHSTSEGDFLEGSSQLVGKKRCRDDEVSPQGDAAYEEEAGAETHQEETILSKAMEDNIQQLRQRVDSFTHQVQCLNLLSQKYYSRIAHNLSTYCTLVNCTMIDQTCNDAKRNHCSRVFGLLITIWRVHGSLPE